MKKCDSCTELSLRHRALLIVAVCFFSWLGFTWLSHDIRATQTGFPGWLIVLPVVIWICGWLVLGAGAISISSSRSRRLFRLVPYIWIVCCIAAMGTVLYGFMSSPNIFRASGFLIVIGFVLGVLALVIMVFAFNAALTRVTLCTHVMSTVLLASAFVLCAGMQRGFLYLYPGIGVGTAAFLLFTGGGLEICCSRPGCVLLRYVYDTKPDVAGLVSSIPGGSWWKFHGAVMVLCGVVFSGVLINHTFAVVPDTVEDTQSVMLKIPVQAAWTWFAEPSRFIMWNTDFTEYFIPEITYEPEGSVYYLVGERNEKRFTLQCIIIKWEEPREYSFVGQCDDFDVYGSYLIEPVDNGSFVTCTEVYSFRNLRETITAAFSEGRFPLQSLEGRMTVLREVAGAR